MSDIRKMEKLVEITKIVTESDNFFDIKDTIIENMLSVVHPTKACVNLFFEDDHNYSHLVCSATLNYIPKLFPKNEIYGSRIDFDLYPKYIHEAVREKKIVIIDDVLNDERSKGEEIMALGEKYKGRAVFPFVINNKTVGFLSCYLTEEDNLTELDIEFISQVASLMALSINITEKNNGIKNLIVKLRNSIANINKASRQLYSSEDMFYFLKKMATVLAETTDSEGTLINVYNIGDDGELVGQKISVSHPFSMLNDLNSLMPVVSKTRRITGFDNDVDIVLPSGRRIKNYIFYKYILDSKSMLVITCVGKKSYTQDDQNTVTTLSKQVALSVQNYEYSLIEEKHKDIENDLTILKSQQKLIMDDNVIRKFKGREIFYFNEPSKSVGGDFYHAVDNDDYFLFIVADVMGHGIVSNFLVALLKGAFTVLASRSRCPKEILYEMNRKLYSEFDKMGAFATVIVGRIDKNTMDLTMANAGHYYPLLIDNEKNVIIEKVYKKALPVGIMDNTKYSEDVINLSDFKNIVFFTDGILEMKNISGDEFGFEKLGELILKNLYSIRNETLKNIKHTIDEYCFNVDKKDDILMVLIR